MCANNVRRACSGERDQALCKGRGARAERLGVTPRGESADYGPRGESADFGEQLLQEMPPSMFDCDEVSMNQSTVLHHAESTACSEVDLTPTPTPTPTPTRTRTLTLTLTLTPTPTPTRWPMRCARGGAHSCAARACRP